MSFIKNIKQRIGINCSTFTELQKLVYEEYVKNGYDSVMKQHGEIGDIAELGLICTEVSEAIETVRKKERGIQEELADIIIRVMNFATRHNIYLEPTIVIKHIKNMKRGKYHGNPVI